MSEIGHNSGSGAFAAVQLRTIVQRIERLEDEKADIAEVIREVYAEAKAHGFDTKTLRAVIRLRKQDKAEREERAALLDLYLHALGMLADTPLGQAAITREVGSQVDIEDAIARRNANPEGGQAGAADETASPAGAASEPAPAAKPKRKTTEERVAERLAAAGGAMDGAHAAAGA